MDAYLTILSETIDKAFNERIDMSAFVQRRLYLDSRRAECVGLVFAVAAVNALKHGFPNGAGGNVEVHFRRFGDRFEMRISDNGVGFDPRSVRRGRGIELMEEVAAQLNGVLRLDSLSLGTTVHLSFDARERQDVLSPRKAALVAHS
jgi:two-component sensor histidine kinase